ncbi:MAG: DUF937 domain-containing protein [Bacteroidetes bacterium]|nr:DUF937 domain-containing protein [Bacteroidota bacterium]
MSGILDLIQSDLGKQMIGGISSQTGTSRDKTADVLSMALPLLTGALQKNANSPQGAASLLGALGKHDGSLLDNLGGLFQGGVDDEVVKDGAGILGHLLGGKQAPVENALSQKTGVSAGQISQILKIAAPLVMAYLGKQSRQNNVSTPDALGGLLGSLSGGSQSNSNQSVITSLLDADGDGSVIDDIAGMAMGKKKGGLGGMLGGLFGK